MTFEHLQIQGAFNNTSAYDGHGVSSPMESGGTTTRILDSILQGNEGAGANVFFGTLIVRNTTFRMNGSGVIATDATLDIDGCDFHENKTGIRFDSGRLRITNSFLTRNSGGLGALNLYEDQPDHSQVEFNTIVDNDVGLRCTGAQTRYPNNLIARNGINIDNNPTCSTPGSIILGNDISTLKFKAPDTPPYDYHLLPGSTAIDAAIDSDIAHDFDGEHRPKGTGRDVGADEAE